MSSHKWNPASVFRWKRSTPFRRVVAIEALASLPEISSRFKDAYPQATSPEIRQWSRDQLTCNLRARRREPADHHLQQFIKRTNAIVDSRLRVVAYIVLDKLLVVLRDPPWERHEEEATASLSEINIAPQVSSERALTQKQRKALENLAQTDLKELVAMRHTSVHSADLDEYTALLSSPPTSIPLSILNVLVVFDTLIRHEIFKSTLTVRDGWLVRNKTRLFKNRAPMRSSSTKGLEDSAVIERVTHCPSVRK